MELDNETCYHIWRGFHLGISMALALDGKQLSKEILGKLREYLKQIVDGEQTVKELTSEERRNPLISAFLPSTMAIDRQTAVEVLRGYENRFQITHLTARTRRSRIEEGTVRS